MILLESVAMSIIFYSTSSEPIHGSEYLVTVAGVEHADGCLSGAPKYDFERKGLSDKCSDRCTLSYHHTGCRGKVVNTREHNGYDDSDFLAEVVVNEETMETKEICYATTRGWTYYNSASIDASPDLLARWHAKLAADAQKKQDQINTHRASLPLVGRVVRVVSKRSKVSAGTTGKVTFFAVSNYAPRHILRSVPKFPSNQELKHFRVGICQDDNTVHYLSASCVEVVS